MAARAASGIVAGSIFTFSLTLGDYIIPQLVGPSKPTIGLAVFQFQGVAGNLPLAAAYTAIPMIVVGDLPHDRPPDGHVRGPLMDAHGSRHFVLKGAVGLGILFLWFPLGLIILYHVHHR